MVLRVLVNGMVSISPQRFVSEAIATFNRRMLKVLLSLIFAIALSHAMRRDNERIYFGLVALGSRISMVGTSAIIGFLLMQGGTYVSAKIVDRLYEKVKMDKRFKDIINYWWRHRWIPTWPLY